MTIWDAGSRGPLDTIRFSTSWLLSPAALFAARTTISLFIFVSIFIVLALDTAEGARRSFSFFTNLTYWGLGFYFAFAAAHTGSYWVTGRPFLEKWPKGLQIAHSIFYTTITTYPLVVSIVYWGLIFNGIEGSFRLFQNTTQHALNTVFCLFEIIVPRTNPTPWFHLVPVIIILALYLASAYVTRATQHFYVYVFIDDTTHSTGFVAGCILGILIGSVIIFTIVHFVILKRVRLTEGRWKKTGRLETRRVGRGRIRVDDSMDFEMLNARAGK